MMATDVILERFRQSIENMPDEEFLKLLAEIEAEPQDENELTAGEFLSLMKGEDYSIFKIFPTDNTAVGFSFIGSNDTQLAFKNTIQAA
jgi:hypothetical protein